MDLAAWELHFRRWPPVSATAVVTMAMQAWEGGQQKVARGMETRFPGAFQLLGVTFGDVEGACIDADLAAVGVHV